MVWEASSVLTASSGDFAPFYLTSNRFGILSSGNNALAGVSVARDMKREGRWSYGFGAEVIGGYTSGVEYERFSPDGGWGWHQLHPSRAFIQQLYGEARWRGLELSLGMKERGSALVEDGLSSGDLLHSSNARPVAQARVGLYGWQEIPFSKGWADVSGEFAYGRFSDSNWWERHSNNYNGHVATGVWYVYRRLYFRSDASQRLSVTLGAQAAGQFGGKTVYRKKGETVRVEDRGVKMKDFFKMIVPHDKGAEGFVQGNTVGCWDLSARYRFGGGNELKAYAQLPWEDGSGMGKLNGWDGLYGLEFSSGGEYPALESMVVEYLDLMNQSGPMHFAPGDNEGTVITSEATGADDYYNNVTYNSYANYGMMLGSPMVMAPVYNRDGWLQVTGNRMRGVHAAARGFISPQVCWIVKAGWRKAYGSGFIPLDRPVTCTSVLAGVEWRPRIAEGLRLGAEIGLDQGKLPGNSFGACLTASYSGKIVSR